MLAALGPLQTLCPIMGGQWCPMALKSNQRYMMYRVHPPSKCVGESGQKHSPGTREGGALGRLPGRGDPSWLEKMSVGWKGQ